MDSHVVREFKEEQPERRPHSKFARRKRNITIISVVLILAIAFSVYHLIGASRLFSGISEAREAMAQAQESAVEFDFDRSGEEVDRARAGLEEAQSGIGFFKWTYAIPWVGDQVEGVAVILDAGVESLNALDQAITIAADVYRVVEDAQALLDETELNGEELTFNTLPADVKADLLRTLHRSGPELEKAQVQLRLAQQDLNRLDELNVAPQIEDAINPFRELLPQLIAGVDFLIPFAATVEEIAGVDADKQWLMLFMNDMEMRPGGGFLGVYGLVTVRDGEIENMLVADTYAVDVLVQFDESYQVPPPEPLARYVGVDKWYFRDANWSPDFPISSQDSIQLLRQEIAHSGQPVPEIHGVFGLTPTFGSWIMELTGPITVQGETFTAENLPLKLEFEVEYGYVEEGIEFEARKEIVGDLVNEVVNRLMALPISQYSQLFSTIEGGFEEKRIALYSRDEQTQASFVDFGWAGKVRTNGADDLLMVVDANMAALKTDPTVERTIEYSVAKEGDDYIATASVLYNHTGEFDQFTTRYRTYTRVYAPLGSEYVSHSGALLDDRLRNPERLPGEVTIADDLGMTSFGAFTSIEPGQAGTLTFTYKLPEHVAEAIESGVYELRVIKQMGAQNHALTLDLDFDKKVRAALPAEDSSQFGDEAYTVNTVLDQDKEFIIQFE